MRQPQRQPVRNPLAYLHGIAQRQEHSRWPGLALAARSHPDDAPGRYALPADVAARPARPRRWRKKRPPSSAAFSTNWAGNCTARLWPGSYAV